MNVAVIGASNKPERYSYQAVKLLAEKGHAVFPVHPAISEIDGMPVFKRLANISVPIHTITVYLAPERSAALADEILAARSKRVIFNPGAENQALVQRLQETGVEAMNACTLVLLQTNQFSDIMISRQENGTFGNKKISTKDIAQEMRTLGADNR